MRANKQKRRHKTFNVNLSVLFIFKVLNTGKITIFLIHSLTDVLMKKNQD